MCSIPTILFNLPIPAFGASRVQVVGFGAGFRGIVTTSVPANILKLPGNKHPNSIQATT